MFYNTDPFNEANDSENLVIKNLRLRSEAAQEIISARTGSLERWSLPIFFLIPVFLIAAGWLIKYPDKITGDGMLLSVNPAGKIIVQQESKLEKVFVANGSVVKEGQTIVWLKNTASHIEINELSSLLENCIKYLCEDEPKRAVHLFAIKFQNLGEFESSYYELIIRWKQFTKFIQQHRPDEDILQHKKEFLEEIRLFRQQLEDWRKKYVVSAPVDGKISFSMPLEQNQALLPGKEIAVVTPQHSCYYAQVVLPQKNLKKIVMGQKAEVAFDAYPVDEYGYLEGRVQYISGALSDSGLVITIELDHGLATNYQKEISYFTGLKSHVSFLGNNERLLKKLYYFLLGNSNK